MPTQILRPRDITRLQGVSRVTLWRWVRDGRFPPPDIRQGPKLIGWTVETYEQHIERLKSQQA